MAEAVLDRVRRFLGSRFARDAVVLQIGAAVGMAGGLATSIATFRLFGAEGYGRLAEAINLYTLMVFAGNAGFATVTITRVSEAMGRVDSDAATRNLGLFVRSYAGLSAVVFAAGWAVCPALGWYVCQDIEVGWWAAVLGALGPLSLPFYTVQCALHGTRRMRLLAEMENLREIVRAACVVFGAVAVGDPRGAILGELTAACIGIPIAWLSYWKAFADPGMELPRVRELLRAALRAQPGEVWSLVRSGLLLSVNKNFTAIMPTVVPRLLLSHFGSARDVGYLNLVQNLMKVPLLAFQGVSRTILPVLGQFRGSGELDRMRSFLVKVMVGSGTAMVVLAGGTALLLRALIPVVYGDAARPAVALLPWFFAAMVIAGFAVGSEGFFVVVGKVHVSAAISLAFALLSVPLGFWMVSQGGAVGAAALVVVAHGGAASNLLYLFSYFRAARRGR